MKTLLVMLFTIISVISTAQTDMSKAMYEGYLTSDLDLLSKKINSIAYDELIASNDIEALYENLELHYVLLSSTLTYEDEVTFSKYVDNSIELAETILKIDKNHSPARAILSGIYGLKIAYAPMKGMFLGPKSGRHSGQSYEMASEDPTVLLMYGINKYNTPSTWGGDTNKAIEVLNKTIAYYENNQMTVENWKYLHALAWLGLAYEEKEEFGKAEAAYKKSILAEPGFEWGVFLFSEVGK